MSEIQGTTTDRIASLSNWQISVLGTVAVLRNSRNRQVDIEQLYRQLPVEMTPEEVAQLETRVRQSVADVQTALGGSRYAKKSARAAVSWIGERAAANAHDVTYTSAIHCLFTSLGLPGKRAAAALLLSKKWDVHSQLAANPQKAAQSYVAAATANSQLHSSASYDQLGFAAGGVLGNAAISSLRYRGLTADLLNRPDVLVAVFDEATSGPYTKLAFAQAVANVAIPPALSI